MSNNNSRNTKNRPDAGADSKHGLGNRFASGIGSAFGMALPSPRSLVGDAPPSTPSFRSVQMAAPSPLALSGSLELRSASRFDDAPTVPKKQNFKVDKAAGLSFGAPFGSSPFPAKSGLAHPHQSTSKINNKNQNDTTQGVTASASKSSSFPTFQPLKWEITVIPAIPFYHPLDRAALSVTISLSVLTSRVSDFMRLRSIACSVQVTDGRLDCVTPDFLSFVVKVWKSDDGDDNEIEEDLTVASLGEDDTVDVTIEVQRRQGSAIEMQNVRNCLYHAIQNGGDGNAAKRPSFAAMEMNEDLVARVCTAPPPPMPAPMSFKSPVPPPPPSAAVPDSLEICSMLLAGNRIDQHRLGMESLQMLTDNTKVCTETATGVAKVLLVGADDGSTVLRESIERYLAESSAGSESVNHTLALRIFAQSLERMRSQWQDLDFSCNFWSVAVAALKANLEQADTRPHEASLSAKSLRLLQTMDPSVCGYMVVDVVQNAHSYGKARHQALELESKQLIDHLITSF